MSHVEIVKTNSKHFLFQLEFSAFTHHIIKIFYGTTFPAVVQKYDATVSREDILLSNDVLFKCGIPSFVADFVSVVGWVDSEGSGYDADDHSALGNLLVYCTETSIFAISFKD